MQRSQRRQKTCHSSCPQHDAYSFGLHLLLQHQEMQNKSKAAVPHCRNGNGASHHVAECTFHVTLVTGMIPSPELSIPIKKMDIHPPSHMPADILSSGEQQVETVALNIMTETGSTCPWNFFSKLPRWPLRKVLKKISCYPFPCIPLSGKACKYFAN